MHGHGYVIKYVKLFVTLGAIVVVIVLWSGFILYAMITCADPELRLTDLGQPKRS
jgi:hypothetical protein